MIGMVIRIWRTEEPETHRLLLRVEGALTGEGAHLLTQQCTPCIHDAAWVVEIDLTAVTFIDETAATVVRRLSQSPSVSLTGCQLFTRQMIEAVPSGEGREARARLRLHPALRPGRTPRHRRDASL
jgi:anti-anti-sigma regulatory factor